MGSQPCLRKRLTEVLKAPKPSPAKTDSSNPIPQSNTRQNKRARKLQNKTEQKSAKTAEHKTTKEREYYLKIYTIGYAPFWILLLRQFNS